MEAALCRGLESKKLARQRRQWNRKRDAVACQRGEREGNRRIVLNAISLPLGAASWPMLFARAHALVMDDDEVVGVGKGVAAEQTSEKCIAKLVSGTPTPTPHHLSSSHQSRLLARRDGEPQNVPSHFSSMLDACKTTSMPVTSSQMGSGAELEPTEPGRLRLHRTRPPDYIPRG